MKIKDVHGVEFEVDVENLWEQLYEDRLNFLKLVLSAPTVPYTDTNGKKQKKIKEDENE